MCRVSRPVPIPPSERSLQTVIAEPWFKVSHELMVLEGPCFERNGNLLCTDVYGAQVFRLTSDKRLSRSTRGVMLLHLGLPETQIADVLSREATKWRPCSARPR